MTDDVAIRVPYEQQVQRIQKQMVYKVSLLVITPTMAVKGIE